MNVRGALVAGLVVVCAALSSCGGGGSGSNAVSPSGLASNDVTAGTTTLLAGQSTYLTAKALLRGDVPKTMVWTATPLTQVPAASAAPIISDSNCATASIAAPATTGGTGSGACQVVLTAPGSIATSIWRITNTATGASGGQIGAYIDVSFTASSAGGLRLMQSAAPVTGYVGKPLAMAMPFTVAAGADVSAVQYAWAANSQNPAQPPIAGANSSVATFTPTAPGQYSFSVYVSAIVNGASQSAVATVVVSVYPANYQDVIDAGLPQTVASGALVNLNGQVLNKNPALNYAYSWSQLSGPSTVSISNANSATGSFFAPAMTGTYVFQFTVIKSQADGTTATTTAQTAVLVQPAPIPLFSVSAGDAQVVSLNTPVALHGNVGAQGTASGVTYMYQWTQVGAAPAAVVLSNAGSANASFVPLVAGTYTFQLAVTASTGSGSTTVSGQTTVVANAANSGNGGSSAGLALSANAGPIQSVGTNAVVTLSGSQSVQGSSSGVTYSYAWNQVGATPTAVVLSNANTATATFFPSVAGTYSFQFTVTATLPDGTSRTASSTTQVVVGGTAAAFNVSAGNAQSVLLGTATTMVGSVTTQGNFSGATFTYTWTQVGSSPAVVTISNANSLTASFVPTVAGTYTFELTVSANNGGNITTQMAQTQIVAHP